MLEGFFTFSSDEPDVTFECSLDSGPFSTCEFVYEFEFEEFDVGQHTFRVRATDFEGNTDPTPATYTWVVTGIVTTVTGGPAYEPSGEPGEPANGGETTDTTAVITFEANVADATFICSIDLGPFTACTSPVTYTGLAVGEHLFQVLATDPETEAEQIEVTEYEWTVISGDDTVPPTTLITSAPADNSSSTVFTFTGADDQTQPLALAFECRLDSTLEADFSDCVSPFNLLDEFPEFAPGEHTFEVRAIDNAEPDGNADPTPASHSWTSVADTVPPQTTMLTGPLTPTVEPDVEFTFNGTDNSTPELLVVFECSVDGGVFEPCDSPESVQGLEPGAHTFEVRAVDLAGNVDSTPASFTWTVVGPPVTSFVSGPDPLSTASAATFVFTSDQLGSTFECSLDGNTFVPCTSPVELLGLTNGTHTFEVQATNTFGLVEDPPAEFAWTITAGADTTPPVTTIISAPAAIELVGEATFEFVSNEVNGTFQCSLDGAAFQTCDSPYEISGLLDGPHTLEVQAVDAALNVDLTPASHTWIVDLPPVAEILGDPVDLTEETTATFSFAANEAVAGFECWLDGIVAPCTSPVSYSGLGLGEHVFAVRAIDDTPSNPSEFENHEWTIVASEPPQTVFNAELPLANTELTSASFSFEGTDIVTPVRTVDLRVLARRCRIQPVHLAGRADRPAGRDPHLRSAGGRRLGHARPDTAELRVDHRGAGHHGAGDDHRRRPAGFHDVHVGTVHLLRRRVRRRLRMRPR